MAKVNISSNYQYVTNAQKSIIESNIPETIAVIQDNLLDFQLNFSSGQWIHNELKIISKELVDMAHYFIEQQDLIENGDLYRGVHAEPSGNGIKFYNDARNSRGQFYAGHIEYGHKARDGKFIPAFPFMRPALYAVSQASQGSFANILADLASGVFRENGKGYQGINNLNFGHYFSKNIKNLGNSKNPQVGRNHQYTRKGLSQKSKMNPKTYMSEILSESQFQRPFSIQRGKMGSGNIKQRKDVGFNPSGLNSNAKTFKPKQNSKWGR